MEGTEGMEGMKGMERMERMEEIEGMEVKDTVCIVITIHRTAPHVSKTIRR